MLEMQIHRYMPALGTAAGHRLAVRTGCNGTNPDPGRQVITRLMSRDLEALRHFHVGNVLIHHELILTAAAHSDIDSEGDNSNDPW